MRTLIKGGHLVDPAAGINGIRDILIENGKILDVQQAFDAPADKEIEAHGLYVFPGLIDLHVHLRDPGFTEKETLATGAMAAAHGGFTTICAMPNTRPVPDSAALFLQLNARAKKEAAVHVLFFAAMTKGQAGKEAVDVKALKQAGCLGLSEDGKSVSEAALCEEVMRAAAACDIPIFDHCEDKTIAKDGVVNEADASARLHLPGIPNAAEDVMTEREIALAKKTGARLHICHISTEGSVAMVREAKKRGEPVTAEATPHHFALSTEDITEDNALFKMNPPLRTKRDVLAIRQGLLDGTIDAIATDHAPHTAKEKACSMKEAPFGVTGLETALPLAYTELVETRLLSFSDLIERMSASPARILGIEKGTLKAGSAADVVLFDPHAAVLIRKEDMLSKAKNSPFIGREVHGKVMCTLVDGEEVYRDGDF